MLWLGKDDRTNPPGDGARTGERGPVVYLDHGGLQPHALAFPGRIASADGVRGVKTMKTARQDVPHASFPGEAVQAAWKLNIG